MHSSARVKTELNSAFRKRHRLHYLKWRLDNANDWSIRYFFIFDDRRQYNGKWVLKSHQEKHYIILSNSEAKAYIKKFAKKLKPDEIDGIKESFGFRKIIIHSDKGCSCFLEKQI